LIYAEGTAVGMVNRNSVPWGVAGTAQSFPPWLSTMLRQIENAYINAALTQTRCNKKEAAKLLGMGRTTLVEKLRRRTAASRV